MSRSDRCETRVPVFPVSDMHCHLDFMADPFSVARDARHAGALLFSNSVEPSGFDHTCALLGNFSNVACGLGVHPWWVHDASSAKTLAGAFIERLGTTRFVGEIGLDFGSHGRDLAVRDAQVSVFKRIVSACAAKQDAVMSIHSVRSADTVLDILEEAGALAQCTCIFHWFSASGDALHRAITAGCMFSVGPHMVATRRGREYARQIPVQQMVLETDDPEHSGDAYQFEHMQKVLTDTVFVIAQTKGILKSEGSAQSAAIVHEIGASPEIKGVRSFASQLQENAKRLLSEK